MAHGHGHKKGCTCGFCRKSHLYAGKRHGGKGKRRHGRRKGR